MVNIIEIYNNSDFIKACKKKNKLCNKLQKEIDELLKILEGNKYDRYNKNL